MGMRNELIAEFIDQTVEDQSWYRKNANTVNGTAAGLAGATAFLLAYYQSTGTRPGLESLLVFLAPLLSAIALKLTRNGIGEVQATEMKRKAALEDRMEVHRERVREEVSRPSTPETDPAATTVSGLPVYRGPSTYTEG